MSNFINNQPDMNYNTPDMNYNTSDTNMLISNQFNNNFGQSQSQHQPSQMPNNYLMGNTGNTGFTSPSIGFTSQLYPQQYSNDIIVPMVNSKEPNLLDGTNLDDIGSTSKMYKQRIKNNDNKSLIKSLTKEIINNLKENNMSIYDNTSINSRKSTGLNKDDDDDDYNDDNDDKHTVKSDKSTSSKRKKKEGIQETIEDFVINNELPNVETQVGHVQWFFDECFNYKDFLILFVLYFVLSQEMIKDFFSKYFTSLNPDSEGKVGVQGVIIYGLILTVIYMLVRKLF